MKNKSSRCPEIESVLILKADRIYAEALSLPLSAQMTEDDVGRVTRALTAALGLDNKTDKGRR